MAKEEAKSNQIIIYKTPEGGKRVRVRFEDENVWLSQKLMADLFDTTVPNINMHLKNIFDTQELDQNSVIKEFLITAADGKKYETKFYSLDAIITVGYRVNSERGMIFRQWATERLKEYMIKGFVLDDARLKQGGHKSRYFEELLQRIRDIRSSERMLYQKITDIYATSIDYRNDAEVTDLFFKTVQNKMHYAATGKTAAQIITERASGAKRNMGLTNFPGDNLIKRDIYIAKNYLNENELQILNRIVDAYLSFAEIQAQSQKPMEMADWITKLDEYLKLLGKGVLKDAGNVSMEQAQTKAETEFSKYKKAAEKKFVSDFDRAVKKYLETESPTMDNKNKSVVHKRKSPQ
jgi:hypothetical protein